MPPLVEGTTRFVGRIARICFCIWCPKFSVLSGRETGLGKGGALTRGHAGERELLDRLVEQPVVVEPCVKVEKDGAEPDGGAVHENEFARHLHRALLPQDAMDPEGLAAAVFRRLDAIRDGALAIIEQRPIDESRPDVERIHQFARKPAEAPGLVGVHHQGVVAREEAVIEIDDAADEARGKDARWRLWPQ